MSENEPIRVIIADDHTIFRDGLKTLFASNAEFQIVGEAGDGDEALRFIRKLRPDILLLDLQMPKRSGMEVLESLSEDHQETHVIMLSGVLEGDQITRAFELGARGVVMKDSGSATLYKSIRAVMAGQYWIGRQAVSSLAQTLKSHRDSTKKARPKNYGLTAREMEVVRKIVDGFSNKEIATALAISEQTVEHHVTSIFDKLGVYNRLELTLFAFHHGIVDK